MITIRQIAKIAGTSPMTVSYALRNSDNISKETRDRIIKIAQENGYSLNPLFSNVMASMRRNKYDAVLGSIAFVNSYPNRGQWNLWNTRRRLMEGIQKRAEERNFCFEEYYIKAPNMTSNLLSRILQRKKIQGLIIGNPPRAHGHLSLKWNWFSCVAQGYGLIKPNIHRVASNHSQNILLALRRLKHFGYRRIGYIKTESSDASNRGLFSSTYEYFAPKLFKEVVPTLSDVDFTYPKLVNWYKVNLPEVIVSLNSHALSILKKQGIRIPQEVGYIDLNIDDPKSLVSGIDPCFEKTGSTAVDFVISMLQNREYGLPEISKTVLIEGHWREGVTLRNRRK